MEVHAHTHTARKKWTHYLWEFLMLFLAVFCGFLAEYQLEHKIEKDREKEYILSLVEDLSEDSLTIFENTILLKANVERMDSLKFLLCGNDVRDRGADLYYLGRLASRGDRLTVNDRTIQQMKNSGGFRLIRKENVSKAIIGYYNKVSYINWLESIELNESDTYRKMAIEVFHPVIFDGLIKADDTIIKSLDNPSLLTYDKEVLIRLAGMVTYTKNTRLGLLKEEGRLLVNANKLVSLLKKEYHLK